MKCAKACKTFLFFCDKHEEDVLPVCKKEQDLSFPNFQEKNRDTERTKNKSKDISQSHRTY